MLIRIVVLLALAAGGWWWWKAAHKPEGYTGGDIRTTGTVEATHVRLGFQVGGRVLEVPVSEGTHVHAGDLLGRLDVRDLDLQVQSAKARLLGARASLQQAEAARTKASSDWKRIQALRAGDATTPTAVDVALAAVQSTQAQVEVARAGIQQAEVALANATLQVGYAQLRAPAEGEVSEKIHWPGEILAAGTPLVSIVQTDTIKVIAAVDETRVGAVQVGDSAQVRIYTFDQRVFPGRVSNVAPAGDFATRKDWGSQRRDIRTFDVTLRVPNPGGLLKDGMTADIRITARPGSTPAAPR